MLYLCYTKTMDDGSDVPFPRLECALIRMDPFPSFYMQYRILVGEL